MTWTRSGAVGEAGKGVRELHRDDLKAAVKAFTSRFKQMSGLEWEDRFEVPIKSKYTFIPDHYDGFENYATKPLYVQAMAFDSAFSPADSSPGYLTYPGARQRYLFSATS